MAKSTSEESATAIKGWLAFAALIALTMLVRGGVLWKLRNRLQNDPDMYRAIAENVVQNGNYGRWVDSLSPQGELQQELAATAFRPPLYPLLLTSLAYHFQVSPWAVACLHFALGLLTVALVYLLASWWELKRWKWFAALLVACDPILLNQSAVVMTETLATFLAVLGLLCLTRYCRHRCWWTATLAGGVLGLAMLCRPAFAVWLALAAFVIVWAVPNWLKRMKNVACYLLAALVMLAPWGMRNYLLFGKPIVTTTHGGFTFSLGNNAMFYDYLRKEKSGKPWDSTEYKKSIEPDLLTKRKRDLPAELVQDKKLNRDTLQFIRNNPSMFLYASAYRVVQLWNPLPHPSYGEESRARRWLRYVTCLWYAVVFLLAILGVIRLRARLLQTAWLGGMLLCLSVTLVHTVYWSNMRMRAPLMPVVCLLAAVGLSLVVKRIGKKE